MNHPLNRLVECVVLGAGGHSLSVIDAILGGDRLRPVAIVDQREETWGTFVLGVPVIGNDEQLVRLRQRGVTSFVNGIGSSRSTALRKRLFLGAQSSGFSSESVIHPSSIVSTSAHCVEGAQLMARSVVGPNARLAENVLVNTGAIVEHDCRIGAHTHLASGVVLAGGVTVGQDVHVGAGAIVIQGICIGERAVIAAGAVVVHDVAADEVVMGVPAKKSRSVAA
ncbi:MAG: NeuD/PglB/VioB family sugar acetyltransferase [Pirellulaceae bacterium]|jgi:UDP-perosamine 4-acetyltransferase